MLRYGKESEAKIPTLNSSNTEPSNFDLHIFTPTNEQLILDNSQKLTGKNIYADYVIAATSQGDIFPVISDETGAFEKNIELIPGINEISIYGFKKNKDYKRRDVYAYYLPNIEVGSSDSIVWGKTRHMSTGYFLLSSFKYGLPSVYYDNATLFYNYAKSEKSSINYNSLAVEEPVIVVGNGEFLTKKDPKGKNSILAKAVFRSEFYTSFVSEVVGIENSSLILKPKHIDNPNIGIKNNENVKVMKYIVSTQSFQPAIWEDIKKEDLLLVQGMDVPERKDVFNVRNVVILVDIR